MYQVSSVLLVFNLISYNSNNKIHDILSINRFKSFVSIHYYKLAEINFSKTDQTSVDYKLTIS